MNRLRTFALAGAGLLALAAAAVGAGLLLEQRRLARQVAVPAHTLALPSDAQALARGRYLYASRGCAGCHGEQGEGRRFAAGDGLLLAGPDLTRAGVTAAYGPADWVRAVRHGVAPGGRPLRVMPSEDYNRLTDADLGALVAHLQALPPAGGAPAVLQWPLPLRLLYAWGVLDDAADRIDHTRPPQAPVPIAVTLEHGRYVAQGCTGCHGAALAGGRIPGGPPHWPEAPGLRPADGQGMAAYADLAAFRNMLASGRRADGSAIAVMPFDALSRLDEVDVQALHLFLRAGATP